MIRRHWAWRSVVNVSESRECWHQHWITRKRSLFEIWRLKTLICCGSLSGVIPNNTFISQWFWLVDILRESLPPLAFTSFGQDQDVNAKWLKHRFSEWITYIRCSDWMISYLRAEFWSKDCRPTAWGSGLVWAEGQPAQSLTPHRRASRRSAGPSAPSPPPARRMTGGDRAIWAETHHHPWNSFCYLLFMFLLQFTSPFPARLYNKQRWKFCI